MFFTSNTEVILKYVGVSKNLNVPTPQKTLLRKIPTSQSTYSRESLGAYISRKGIRKGKGYNYESSICLFL